MDLLKYLEPMKNIPERFSNLAFWRGVRKLKDEVVSAFEYIDSWGEGIESSIADLTRKNNKSFSVFDNTSDINKSSPYVNLVTNLQYQSKLDTNHNALIVTASATEFSTDYNFKTPPNEDIIFCGAEIVVTCDGISQSCPCMVYLKAVKYADKWTLTGRVCYPQPITFYNFTSTPTNINASLLIGIGSNYIRN